MDNYQVRKPLQLAQDIISAPLDIPRSVQSKERGIGEGVGSNGGSRPKLEVNNESNYPVTANLRDAGPCQPGVSAVSLKFSPRFRQRLAQAIRNGNLGLSHWLAAVEYRWSMRYRLRKGSPDYRGHRNRYDLHLRMYRRWKAMTNVEQQVYVQGLRDVAALYR